jgi:CelD/BcsL family acetyltransferase involved in cellulose biosynthesis
MSQTHPVLDRREIRVDHVDTDRSPYDAEALDPSAIVLSVSIDIAKVEAEWRLFQQHADCTAFQAFEWLAAWQRYIGEPAGVMPVIVTGRRPDATLLFIFPLALVQQGRLRQLSFLGRDLGDYNAPLLTSDFAQVMPKEAFPALWQRALSAIRNSAAGVFDLVLLDKMPETIGPQANPFLALGSALNPSGAYFTRLGKDWDSFYLDKRSSATRRRDRTKRKRLSESGEILMVTPQDTQDFELTFETLVAQKRRAFARMGVPDIFDRPGYIEFFRAIASAESGRRLGHVSRLQVGSAFAAVNLGLEFRRRYYHVLASYDEAELSRFGPGIVHLHELMKYAISHGCREFDFTIGDEPYKREWSDCELKLYDHIEAVTWRGSLIAGPLLAARRAKRALKQSRLLWPFISRVRATVGRMKGGRRKTPPSD